MEAILPSRPESNWQLLKRSFLLYTASFSKTIFFAFLLALVVFIPRFLADVYGHDLFVDQQPLSPHRLWIWVINVISLTLFIAILWHMHCVVRHQHDSIKEDFIVGVKKVIYAFVAAIIESTILFVVILFVLSMQLLLKEYNWFFTANLIGLLFAVCFFLAQVFLILYVSTLFYFLIPLIAVENAGILSALKRSITLVWNHWWRTITLQLTPWLCYLLLLLLLKFIIDIDIHIYFMDNVSRNYGATAFNLLIFTLFIPWVAAVLLVQLKDLELRKKLAHKVRS